MRCDFVGCSAGVFAECSAGVFTEDFPNRGEHWLVFTEFFRKRNLLIELVKFGHCGGNGK